MCKRWCDAMGARSPASLCSAWGRRSLSPLHRLSRMRSRMLDTQHVTLLLVEDDPGHARLIERNLRRAHITNEIITLSDGQQAIDYLFKERTYRGAMHAMPLLMLLDLNLPQLDGYQVLERIKADERT